MKAKGQKGITLIALVITIIVLLILAGVTIATLSGNNSAPQKATEAAQKDAIAGAKDEIAMETQEALLNYYNNKYVSKTSTGASGEAEVQSVVAGAAGRAVDNAKSRNKELEGSSVSGNTITLKTKSYEVTGTIDTNGGITWSDSNGSGEVTATEVNALIGKTVNYTAPAASGYTGAWQVFYADEGNNEVFIISKDVLKTKTGIVGDAAAYSNGPSSSSLLAGTYGRKYNLIWLGITNAGLDSTGTTVNENAKSVAYLCDASTTGHWAKYAGGTFGTGTTVNGTYAVGGPTIELLAKSVTANPNVSGDYANAFTTSNVTNVGYPNGSISGLPEPYKAKYDETNYGSWWLASPSSSNALIVRGVSEDGNMINQRYISPDLGVRPLVSIPLSSFQTSWINQNS